MGFPNPPVAGPYTAKSSTSTKEVQDFPGIEADDPRCFYRSENLGICLEGLVGPFFWGYTLED